MRLFMLILVALIPPGGAWARSDYAPQGQMQEFSLPVAGVERWTTVYRPQGYRAGAPVVLLLHGGTQSMRKILKRNAGGTRHWLALADREKFLLLVPNATNAETGDANGDKQNWNDLRTGAARGKSSADDVGFLVRLLEWAREKYQYDPRRVYVTGASNGGMMTFRLLVEQPQRFTAAAAFIASLPVAPPKPAAGPRVPLMLLNGTRDPLVQWQGGTIRGERGETMAIEPMVQWWLDVNGVNRERADTESLPDLDPRDGCRISRTTWPADHADAAPVVFYRAEGGGHTLPSIAYPLHSGPILHRIIGPVCHDAEGAELAWDFFKSFAGSPEARH
jgi:polyhydroxybutyrate depolymerase